MPPGSNTETKHIKVEVTSKGDRDLKILADSMGGVNRNVRKLTSDFGSLKNIVEGFIGASFLGVGIGTITNLSDTMQNLGSRIAVLSGGTENARAVMGDLLEVANETKSSLDGVATIYSRLAASTKDLGVSSNVLEAITRTLQNTFRLSGATTAEATAATIQLSQGLASGQLRGQELRSVLEQNVVFGDLLTKSTGRTRGELYKLAEAGKLTSDVVFKALAKGMDDVNSRADTLGQTFEQTLTVAVNNFKLKIFDINKEFDISGKFAKSIQFVTDNIYLFAGALGAIVTVLAAPVIAGIGAAIAALSVPILSVTGAIAGLSLGAGVVVNYFKELKDFGLSALQVLYGATKILIAPTLLFVDAYRQLSGVTSNLREESEKYLDSKIMGIERERTLTNLINQDEKERLDIAKALKDQATKNELNSLKGAKVAEDLVVKRANLIKELNNKYADGRVSIAEYYDQLRGLDAQLAKNQFLTGKKDLSQFNEEIRKLEEADLNRKVGEGTISVREFNSALEEINLGRINEELASGKIALDEYDASLNKISSKFETDSVFRQGAADYIKSVGTLSSQIAGLVTSTFGKLEDALVTFVANGKFSFKDFTQAVLDDLNRIIIRSLIIKPLAEGVLAGFNSTPGTTQDYSGPVDTGTKGLRVFASGGVVTGRTSFSYGGGKSGLMGEAGPEAIIPLKRSSNGDLGVASSTTPVVINIQNNSGQPVSQTESTGPNGEKLINILVGQALQEGVASGKFDRTFQNAYGLTRKGS